MDNISSLDIERFIMGLNNIDQPTFEILDTVTICNDRIDLKEISKTLEINYETARKLANNGWFDVDKNVQIADKPQMYSKKKFIYSKANTC